MLPLTAKTSEVHLATTRSGYRAMLNPSIKKSVLAVALMLTMLSPRQAHAEPMRDFIVSCSYGVMAGTLVGAATLAFSSMPGQSLNNVARGASIGLYAGIFLGAYVVFGSQGDDEDAAAALGGRGVMNDLIPSHRRSSSVEALVFPLVGEKGIEGLAGQAVLARF
jgi:uncharacterized membrane protein